MDTDTEQLRSNSSILPLAEAIASLRDELEAAVQKQRQRMADAAAKGESLLIPALPLSKIVLDLEVVTTLSAEIGGGVKFWAVVDTSAKGKRDRDTTQRLSLTFDLGAAPLTLGEPSDRNSRSF